MTSGGKATATSIVDAIQLAYEALVLAFGTGDRNSVNPVWHRLQLLAHVGGFTDVEARATRFWDATGSGDHVRIDEALRSLRAAVVGLRRPSLREAASRGAISAVQLSYVEFLLAQQDGDSGRVTEWWHRLRDAAQLGGLSGLEQSLGAYLSAMASRDRPRIERATEDLYQAVVALA